MTAQPFVSVPSKFPLLFHSHVYCLRWLVSCYLFFFVCACNDHHGSVCAHICNEMRLILCASVTITKSINGSEMIASIDDHTPTHKHSPNWKSIAASNRLKWCDDFSLKCATQTFRHSMKWWIRPINTMCGHDIRFCKNFIHAQCVASPLILLARFVTHAKRIPIFCSWYDCPQRICKPLVFIANITREQWTPERRSCRSAIANECVLFVKSLFLLHKKAFRI